MHASWLSGEKCVLVREMAAEAKGMVKSCRVRRLSGIRSRIKVKAREKRMRQQKIQEKVARPTKHGPKERTGNSAGLLGSPHRSETHRLPPSMPTTSEHSPGAVSMRKHP